MVLKGRKILLGVTGSIAAYKSAFLVRLLIREGAEVKVIMTAAAKDFIAPLTLSTLSRNPVLSELFNEDSWSNHVMLGRWADVMLIAPLSVNTLAKMATGLCDNLLLATWLSATCPVVLAPAMDEDMWHHPATKTNLERLRSYGNHLMPVANGELASGLTGDGRMAEPDEIVSFITALVASMPVKDLQPGDKQSGGVPGGLVQGVPAVGSGPAVAGVPAPGTLPAALAGRKALVTAGPTYEAIDPVRFIGNHSSGKMGVAIAEELARRGAEVTLVIGPSAAAKTGLADVRNVVSAAEMFDVCNEMFDKCDLAIMAAAVADYTPVNPADQKIKKSGQNLHLELRQTTDILKTLGSRKRNDQVLVGFALETVNEKESARSKLISKNADLVVLNSLNDEGAGFGFDTNKVTVVLRNGQEIEWPLQPKEDVAKALVELLINKYYV